jgi:hypothetical protein
MILCFSWGWNMIENCYATESENRRARGAAPCDHQGNRTGKAFTIGESLILERRKDSVRNST